MSEKELLKFLNHHIDQEPDRILEVGCGLGRLTKYLKKRFRNSEILCIDKDNDVIKMLKTTFKEKDNFKIKCHDAIYPVNDKPFDLIIGFQVFPFVEKPKKFFDTLIEQLTDSGELILLEVDMLNLYSNINIKKLNEFYGDFVKGLKLLGVDYNFGKIYKYLDTDKVSCEKHIFEKIESYKLSEKFLKMIKEGLKSNTRYFNESLNYYYQFLKKVGWSKAKCIELLRELFTFEIYKDYKDMELIRKTPYYLFKITKINF